MKPGNNYFLTILLYIYIYIYLPFLYYFPKNLLVDSVGGSTVVNLGLCMTHRVFIYGLISQIVWYFVCNFTKLLFTNSSYY